MKSNETIISEYYAFLREKGFPCVAAKAAVAKSQIRCMIAAHMQCPAHDSAILNFIYDFVDSYRIAANPYHSAAIIFREPGSIDETTFDELLWMRLNSLRALDRNKYRHDPRVDEDPASARYSFSLKEEAFFIIGLHPGSPRRARRFQYPTLVFNPHAEFEKLRKSDRYTKMKETVRKRDMQYSGSVNPMLADFGDASEVFQYSGLKYQPDWVCPIQQHVNKKSET